MEWDLSSLFLPEEGLKGTGIDEVMGKKNLVRHEGGVGVVTFDK